MKMPLKKDKNLLRLQIIQHVSDYLAKGKKIQKIPFGEQNEDINRGRGRKGSGDSGKPFRTEFSVKRGEGFARK